MRTVDAAGLAIGDGHPPRIMGVLNVSSESPYDPSVFDDPSEAAAYVDEALIDEGADIVDVGLESANKRFEVLSAEQELDRLDVAVDAIESVSGDAVFSIETRYAEVADAALDRGFDMVNDICGFADSELPEICQEHDVAVVKMASPPDLERPGAVGDVDWAEERSPEWAERATYVDQAYESLTREGLTDKTIVDPAFGGWSETKTLADDRETFERLPEFRALGRPVLVSINRKNFLGEPIGRDTDERLASSLAATAMAVERGTHVIRTHDVAETRDAALIADHLSEESVRASGPISVEELPGATVRTVERRAERLDADPIVARESAAATVELRGLSSADRDELADAAERAGVAFAPGSEERGLLAGTVGAFDRLEPSISDDSDRLADAIGTITGTDPERDR